MIARRILQAVATEYGLEVSEMLSPRRKRLYVEPRQMASLFLHEEAKLTSEQAGIILHQHRTTAYYSVQAIADLIYTDKRVKSRFKAIQSRLEVLGYERFKTQKEMNIKLTAPQLEGIHLLINMALNIYKPDNIGESLLHEIVDKVNDKIRLKLKRKQFDNKVGNNLTLTSVEAKAFYVWYNQICAQIHEEHYQYERIVATQIINQIDRVYA